MFPLFQIITVLKNYINSCENTCGLGISLPIDSKAPEEDRGRGIVTCSQELCLEFDENYDKYGPPRGSKQQAQVSIDDNNDPFQSKNISSPAVAESKKSLMVMLQATVNTVSDFRFDEDCFSIEFPVKISWDRF